MAGSCSRLKLALGGEGPKPLLFCGQFGDGKTTILIQAVCGEALAYHEDLPFNADDVAIAIHNFGASRHLLAADHKQALAHVAENRSLDQIEPEERWILLYNRLIYEYFDGDYWFDICPLAQRQGGHSDLD